MSKTFNGETADKTYFDMLWVYQIKIYFSIKTRVSFPLRSDVQSGERISCKLKFLSCIYLLSQEELPSNAVVGFQQTWYQSILSPDKAHFIHVADDTNSAHLSKQQTQVRQRALHDSCTKSTSNWPLQTRKTSTMKWPRSQNYIYTKADAQAIISNQTCSHTFVLKTHKHSVVWVNTTPLG